MLRMKHLICITVGGDKVYPTKAMMEFVKNDIKDQLKDYPDLIPLVVVNDIAKIQVESLYD